MPIDREQPGATAADPPSRWERVTAREPIDWPPGTSDLDAIRRAAARLGRGLDAAPAADGLAVLTASVAELGRAAADGTAAMRAEIATLASALGRGAGGRHADEPQRRWSGCDAVAIDGLRSDIAALRLRLHRRRRQTRRAAAAEAAPAMPGAGGAAAPADPSPAEPVACPAAPTAEAPAAAPTRHTEPAAGPVTDARLARIESLLAELVSIHARQASGSIAGAFVATPLPTPVPARPPLATSPPAITPPPADAVQPGAGAAPAAAGSTTFATASPSPASFGRMTSLIGAVRRAEAGRAAPDDAATDRAVDAAHAAVPVVAAAEGPPRASVPAKRVAPSANWTPRLVAGLAAVTIAAGGYGLLRDPWRTQTTSRQPAGGWIAAEDERDPATTGSLPDVAAAAPFAVEVEEAGGGPAADFHAAITRLSDPRRPQDAAAAADLLLSAARAGVPQAAFRLATLYERGAGVPQSRDAAIDWYRRAAARGHVNAMHNLAALLSTGADADTGATEAAAWFRKAAERGFVDSQFNLAILLGAGLGGRADPLESYRWLAIAAAEGDRDAARRRDELSRSLDARRRADIDRDVAAWRPRPIDPAVNDEAAVGASTPPGG